MINMKELSEYIATIYPATTRKVVVPYKYPITFTNLTAGQTQTGNINITANADFIHTRTGFHATNVPVTALTASSIVIPAARVLLNDSGTNENFSQAAIDLGCFITQSVASGFVEDEPYPRVISGRSNISVQIVSYESAAAYNIDIVLIGVLVRAYNT